MPESSYNPIKYWTERGKWYMPVFLTSHPNPKIERQERILMQYLLLSEQQLCSGRILEVGAGFGRISKLVLEKFHQRIEEYVLLDISKDQLYNARVYLANNLEPSILQSVNIKFIQCDFMDFASADKFDLVLAVEVLMHVLPADIEKAVNALVSLSSKDVLTVDWYDNDDATADNDKKAVAAHNFLHDYPTLYKNNEKVESFKRIPLRDSKKDVPEQSLFHVIKKKEKVFGWFMRSTTTII